MKNKVLLIFILFSLSCHSGHAQTIVTYPDDFAGGWNSYIGKSVTFTNRFYIIGIAGGGYGYSQGLLLAPTRLRTADDLYAAGTPEHAALKAVNENIQVTATFSGGKYGLLRLGNYIENLTATVTAEKTIHINSYAENLNWEGNPRPVRRPDLGDASLVVCGSNLQNYYPFYWRSPSGTFPSSATQSELQNSKITAAMLNIDADIYGLAEVQDTCAAIEYLANSMNRAAGVPDKYGYITDYQPVSPDGAQSIRTGYIYRTDKVLPVLGMGLPDASSFVYSHRQYVQAFEERENGGRFMLSINHFKARGDNTEAARITNMTNLINFLDIMEQIGYYGDSDVLVMGDLNAYSAEEPVKMLERKEYVNQLTRFSPESYTYVYDNLVGNMDHALASPSLSPQVTGAAPYLLNADEPYNYRWSGNLATRDMYCYSDHNPVLVGLRLTPDNNTGYKDLDIHIPFSTTLAPFIPYNVAGKKSWGIHTQNNCAYITGYGEETANEDWLVSPAFDLSKSASAQFSFSHQIGYGGNAVQTHNTLWISNNYRGGDPSGAQWEQLPVNYASSGYTSVVAAIPPKYLCAGTCIAFKYISDPGETGTKSNWSIKDLSIRTTGGQVPTECEDIDFREPFSQNTGDFIMQNVKGQQSWYWKSSNYGVAMSGYKGTNVENEDWLISPAFDLSDKTDPTLTFDHVINFCPSATALAANHTLLASVNYTGGLPSSAEWTQIAIPDMPSGTSWNDWAHCENIVIPENLRTKNVRFAFRYLSTLETASTWQIKNLTFNALCKGTALEENETSAFKLFTEGRNIRIENVSNLPVAVYDMNGRCLLVRYNVGNETTIPLGQAGTYLVKVGNTTRKITIK